MKREFLEGLGLEKEAIDKVMAENGRDIEREKAKFADYEEIKKALDDASKKLETAVKEATDIDVLKAELEKHKAEKLEIEAEYQKKIQVQEIQAKVKDFTSNKKFVNDLTRDVINSQLAEKLNSEDSKGKSLDEIFASLTEGKENILIEENNPKPPVVAPMSGAKQSDSGLMTAFKKLNPNLEI